MRRLVKFSTIFDNFSQDLPEHSLMRIRAPRIVTAEDLRARLGRELDAVRESQEALYVSKRGRLAAVLLDADRYGELIERLEFLEDSLAVLQARDEGETAVPWAAVRE
jgi:prevent-host-death family protein